MHDGKDQNEAFSEVLGTERLDSADSYGVDEFPPGASEWVSDEPTRRSFLKRMSAALALAGMVGCSQRPDGETIVPHVDPPDSQVPGLSKFYASTFVLNGYGKGVRVTSREGRPIKIEGNPEHPASLGATDVFMQASILDLYDPTRAKSPTRGGSAVDWSSFRAALKERTDLARKKNGKGLRILSGPITSPSLIAQIQEAARQYPEARWHFYTPLARTNSFEATAAAFGRPLNVYYDFSKARTIVSLDSDFLFDEPGSVRYSRDWMDGRRVRRDKHEMNRLYVAESSVTLTGSMADHRFAMKPSDIGSFAQNLLEAVQNGGGSDNIVKEVAKDLAAAKGASLVIAGPHQPKEVHQAAYAINAALGNIGQTVKFTEALEARPNDPSRSLSALVADMDAGLVETLIIVGENPAFTAPADVAFAEALKKMSLERGTDGQLKNFTAHISLWQNETSFVCQWHLPEAHYLEAWSDVRAYDGTVSLIQPLIAPLYGGRSAHEILAEALGAEMTGYDIVRNYWKTQVKSDFESWWRMALKRGVIADSEAPSVKLGSPKPPAAAAPAVSGQFQIVFRPDYAVWDGTFARNAWMMECPRPFTKLVWDNAALVSPNTYGKLNLQVDHLLKLTVNGKSVEAPVWIIEGLPDDVINVSLGYGAGERPAQTEDGIGVWGFNAYLIRPSGRDIDAVEVAETGNTYRLISTMSHYAMRDADNPKTAPNAIVTTKTPEDDLELSSRRLIRVIDLEDYEKNPDEVRKLGGAKDNRPLLELFNGGWDYTKGYQWGMSIDTSACTGCNACVIACQSENNIPVVGKDQVDRQREMHWIRIDDYFAEAPDQPLVTHQPVNCQHCENAPCEYVCPVGATSHSAEGLNQMTYNRCVGTRYCSNNCPYKVRRFNFLDYTKEERPESRQLRNNPEVTVRERGVMEKCSLCVQRINRTRIEVEAMLLDMDDAIARTSDKTEQDRLKAEKNRKEYDMIGGIQTACQQSCPTQAIVFGSTLPVAGQPTPLMALKKEPANYSLLYELTTKPRVTYLARVRNTNPALA